MVTTQIEIQMPGIQWKMVQFYSNLRNYREIRMWKLLQKEKGKLCRKKSNDSFLYIFNSLLYHILSI